MAGSRSLYNCLCLRHVITSPRRNTMRRSCTIVVLATVLQVIFGQEILVKQPGPTTTDLHPAHPNQAMIPRHCWGPPIWINTNECCPIPSLYPDEVFDACGIEKPSADGRPKGAPDFECKRGKCLMNQMKLLKEDGETMDIEKLGAYIEDWAKANPDFTEAILIAKDKCVREGGPTGHRDNCGPDRLFFCMNRNIFWNCKLNETIEGCQFLKKHREECRPFYMTPPGEEAKKTILK